MSTSPRSTAIVAPSQSHGARTPSSENCPPRPVLLASGATRASAAKPAAFWRLSTAGSPKASSQRSSRTQRLLLEQLTSDTGCTQCRLRVSRAERLIASAGGGAARSRSLAAVETCTGLRPIGKLCFPVSFNRVLCELNQNKRAQMRNPVGARQVGAA